MILKIPLYFNTIKAGFPSPGEECVDKTIDLNEELISHPSSTFFARVSGDSMINAGIYPDDILIVDKSLEAKSGDIVIAIIEGEFLVKRYIKQANKIILKSENLNYKNIVVNTDDFSLWGVVTYSIRKH